MHFLGSILWWTYKWYSFRNKSIRNIAFSKKIKFKSKPIIIITLLYTTSLSSKIHSSCLVVFRTWIALRVIWRVSYRVVHHKRHFDYSVFNSRVFNVVISSSSNFNQYNNYWFVWQIICFILCFTHCISHENLHV